MTADARDATSRRERLQCSPASRRPSTRFCGRSGRAGGGRGREQSYGGCSGQARRKGGGSWVGCSGRARQGRGWEQS
eukprot:31415-Chlamydomonas_euryale.AAC.1